MISTRLTLALGLVLAFAGSAFSGDAMIGDLHIEAPWARASIGPAKAGAAYVTVVNHGGEADRLVAVETDVARRSELHTHLMEEGVMKMRQVEAIEVDPGAPMVMAPGGLHVMLMGLKQPLEQGSRFPLRLVFERAGKVEVMVEVLEPAAMGPSGDMKHDGSTHDHDKHDDHSS